jgi:modulator of FtsH protease
VKKTSLKGYAMGLYDRNYISAESGVLQQETASVDFIKKTYQLLAASMLAAAAGAYATMPIAQTVYEYKWFIFGVELLILFFGLGMSRGKPGLNLMMLFAFTFLTGVSLVPLLATLIGLGKGAVIGTAFLMTAVLLTILSTSQFLNKTDEI